VLRFWNNDVTQNRDGVLESIAQAAGGSPPSPPSPINGRGIKAVDKRPALSRLRERVAEHRRQVYAAGVNLAAWSAG
jgi:hypothetical protein